MARYVARFGALRNVGVFQGRERPPLTRGTRVVLRTPRGTEVGEVLCAATEQALKHLERPPGGQVLRELSDEDVTLWNDLTGRKDSDYDICASVFRESGLPMQLVDTERLLGGEKIVVYFLAEGRVDFRGVVRTLAARLASRIELWQIQPREEAKLLAEVGDCGKELCCVTHLATMPKVTMKMAKLQRATLDPTKISGRCGRLKCCLRYEFETYEALQKPLPKLGSRVTVRDQGTGRVLSTETLSQQVLVQTDDGRRVIAPLADVMLIPGGPRGPHSDEGRSRSDGHDADMPAEDGRRPERPAVGRPGRGRGNERRNSFPSDHGTPPTPPDHTLPDSLPGGDNPRSTRPPLSSERSLGRRPRPSPRDGTEHARSRRPRSERTDGPTASLSPDDPSPPTPPSRPTGEFPDE